MVASVLRLSVAAALLASCPTVCRAEVFSDLADVVSPSPSVQRMALEAKADAFWRVVSDAAENMKLSAHMKLYVDTEKVLAELPAENTYVREALQEVLMRIRRADEMVLTQAVESSDLASDRLAAPLQGESMFSFFTGGQNFLKQAIRRFVSGGSYAENLDSQVHDRQAEILPVLRGAASATGNVLSDTRLASKRSFDILKYDIYNKGVPKTPQAAKDIANRLVEASSETRRRFTQFITKTVNSIADDFVGRHDGAAASSVQSSLHEAVARAEAAERAGRPRLVDV
eukprot:SRR837773.20630.p1 GENE.SRR837773.20630~~SRR837773.20630.p1  ORF type:complete len:296 (+),score=81.11 SRR837773.20630:31-888(+)